MYLLAFRKKTCIHKLVETNSCIVHWIGAWMETGRTECNSEKWTWDIEPKPGLTQPPLYMSSTTFYQKAPKSIDLPQRNAD